MTTAEIAPEVAAGAVLLVVLVAWKVLKLVLKLALLAVVVALALFAWQQHGHNGGGSGSSASSPAVNSAPADPHPVAPEVEQ